MKTLRLFPLVRAVLFALCAFSRLHAAAPANENFEDYVVDNVTLSNPYDRHAIRYTMAGAIMRIIDGTDYGSEFNSRVFYFNYGWQAVTTFSVSAPVSSDNFQIVSMKMDSGFDATMYLIEGLNDGAVVASASVDLTAGGTYGSITYTKTGTTSGTLSFNATTDPDWKNIDTIRFTALNGNAIAFIDDLVFAEPPVSPAVSTVSAPGNATYAVGQALNFTVNCNEAITVTGTPRLGLTIGSSTVYANYVSGSGTAALVFRYTVQAGDLDSDGIAVTSPISLNGGTMNDSDGNAATLTFTPPSTTGVKVDGVAPTVTSITRLTPSTSVVRSTSVVFQVTFSESVTGVDASWFNVTTVNGGTTTGTIASVTGGPSVYAVTVTITGGAGDFRLGLVRGTTTSTFATGVGSPAGMDFDAAGNLYIGDTNGSTVKKVTSGGVVSTLATGIFNCYGLAVSSAGDIYVANGSAVKKITSGGVVSTFATGFNVAGGMTFDAAGNLYVGNYGNSTISKVTSGGSVSTFATSINAPFGLKFDSAGNLYVANRDAGTITKIAPDNTTTTFASGINGPHEMEFDSAGNLYVADRWGTRVAVVAPNGTLTTLVSGLGAPYGMAVDSSGNLYVSNYLVGNNIIKLTFSSVLDAAGNAFSDTSFSAGQVYTYDPNDAPTDIQLSNTSVNASAGANATVGTLSTTDADSGDTHTYSLVAGAGSTDNSAFNISGSTLRANSATSLAAGSYAVRVQTDDGQGGTYAEAFSITVVDDIAPTVTSVSVPANAVYGAGQNLDFTVNFSESVLVDTAGGTPRIALTLATGGTVYADYLSGSGTSALTFRYTIATGNSDSDGITVGALSANGGTLKDAALNSATLTLTSVGSTTSVTVDGVAPIASSINRVNSALTHDVAVDYTVTFSETVSGVSIGDFTLVSTGTASGTISGVTSVNGTTYTVAVSSVSGDGTLRLDLNSSGTGIADTAGNAIATGFTGGQTYTIDTTAPAAPSVTGITNDTGTSTTDGVTSDTTLVISGSAEANSTVTVLFNGISAGTTTANGSGAWSFDHTATTLAPATYAITATATDAASNVGAASSPFSVTVDTVAPAAPTFLAISSDTGTSSTDQITTDTTLVLSGTAEANAVVTLSRNAVQIGTATANGSGAWTFDYTGTTLGEGTHTFTATATDLAGNVSGPSAAFLVEIDVSTPATPAITGITNDGGTSASDGITNDNTLMLSGTAEAGTVVTIARNTVGVIGTATTNGSGQWTFDYSGTTLADGSYLFTAFASDTAGNASAVSPDFAVVVDTTPPAITAQPVGGTYAAGDSFTLAVTATDAQALSYRWALDGTPLTDNSNRTGSTTATVTHSGIGTVGFSGNYTVVITDVAGNTSTSSIATVLVNRAEQTITFPAIADRLTTSAPFTIGATASSGFVVTFSVVSGPATVSGNTVTVTGAGTVTIRASQAGDINIKPATADTSFEVSKASASVSLSNLSFTYDGGAKTASAATTPAGLVVEFTYDGGTNAPSSGGSYAVVGTIVDATYQGTGSGTLTIAAANQSLNFNPSTAISVAAPVTLTATATSGLPVSFALISGSATLSGATLIPTAAGDIVVRAVQPGNGNYQSVSVDRTLTASKVSQTIAFDALPNRLVSDAPFALTASATSGLPVTFAIVDGPATLSGSTVALLGASGTVTIRASQAGNSVYAAASDVTQSFEVGATGPQVYFGETTQHDTIAAALGQDNTHGTIIGYLGGTLQGFVAEFTIDADGIFQAVGTLFASSTVAGQSVSSTKRQARSVTLIIAGVVHNGVISGTVGEDGLGFTATIQPPTGATAAMAGYYTAPATDTAEGSMYTVVGTAGQVFVLAVTPDLIVAGSGTADARGSFTVAPTSSLMIAGQINSTTATISSTLRLSGATINFNGIATTTARTDRLVNLSSRGTVSPQHPLIAGFVIGGTESKRVLLRGMGPTLTKLGVNNAVSDPKLRLFNQRGEVLFENDDWAATSEMLQATQQVGAVAPESGSKDAALIVSLPPGAYTIHVWSNTGNGVALAEVYDASETSDEYQRLLNISSRSLVGTGENVLIGGFVVTGNSPKRLLVRGCGPALARFGLTGLLPNPTLRVMDRAGELIARNDDWGIPIAVETGQTSGSAAEVSAAAVATGAFPLEAGSKDAALIVTLNPGVYTVVLADEANTGGDGMVEIYELP